MKTFNIDIWQTLRSYTDTNEKRFCDGKIYFGLAPENTPAPYCVLHVLNSGEDMSAQTLCLKDEGYNLVGVSDIQFNVYATNDMYLDELLQELNDILRSFQNLTEYRIVKSERLRTKNASTFTNEVGIGFTEYLFQYEKL